MKQENLNKPLAIALGFFDGVHLGHAALMEKVKAHPATAAALTFDQHPASSLGKNPVPLLSTVEDRCWIMEEFYQIQKVVLTEFSRIQSMSWRDFISEFLQKELCVQHVVAGHDFRFGKGGEGDTTKLQQTCAELGMTCEIIPAVSVDDQVVSSTHIRKLMEQGAMSEALHFLGHPHIISNKVQHGNKIGKNTLGFPTVNLAVPPGIAVPAFGVYACRVWVGERKFNAVTNIGIRPTVTEEDDKGITIEGFLLDFPDEALYGQTLRMEFYTHLRGEKKFDSFPELSKQIARDVQSTRDYFKSK